jgi:CheY-like chemotaxis protein
MQPKMRESLEPSSARQSFWQSSFSAKQKALAVAISLSMLPVIAVGTTIYYQGNKLIDSSIVKMTQHNSVSEAKKELLQQKPLLNIALLGTEAIALLAGGLAIVATNRLFASKILTTKEVNLESKPIPTGEIDELKQFLNEGDVPQSTGTESRTALNPDQTIAANPVEPTTASSQQFEKYPTILVVDDSATIREIVSLTLEKIGYRAIHAEDGHDALIELHRHPELQAIITDVEMPNMDGFELLLYRSQHPELAKLPTILLSNRRSQPYQDLAKQLGADAYFTKPYDESEFLATINSIMNTRYSHKLRGVTFNKMK